ncbi:MAG TPA: maleylpyruvate isomerase family mycothiol-dependent enzyme [Acidothermaceae bacterium]
MEVAEHVDVLIAQGRALFDAARAASMDAVVPPCPGWTVRDLVTHVGGVHRWAAAIVGGALSDSDDATGGQVGKGPDDAQLLEWFRDGHRALVQTLQEAPSDLACFTFLPAPSPLAFWARRQAHETAIHRADAEAVGGVVSVFDTEFARDGIDEILRGFASRPRPEMQSATLKVQLDAVPDTWVIRFGPRGLTVSTDAARALVADLTVSGSASSVYLWLWNRPAEVSLVGDPRVVELWRQIRVRWS